MHALATASAERLRSEVVLAVVRADSPRAAVGAARALAAGGVRAIEITFTTPDAPAAIRELAEDPELFVGAGTVLHARHAEQAIEAGAAFLVSPSLALPVVETGTGAGVLTIPGALTPTEVSKAAECCDVVKLFPASLGGVGYLRALLAPFPRLRVLPTGGVTAENAREWLASGAFALGAGSDLCPATLVAQGRFAELAERARRYRHAVEALVS